MTPHRRAALAFRTAALASVGGAIWMATHHERAAAGFLAWGVFFLLFLGGRCQKVHLVDLARHEQARLAARTDAVTLAVPLPCCSFWRHSGGVVHGPDCTQPLEARYMRDGLPLNAEETAAFDAIIAHALKEH
ncbi:hypothetical protein ACFUIY_14665 [Streptomyces griseorubiginosus]|uniref:hypothetical protein n=1 Tax=Streptomyces griseorubiginosus TaxID=67304 RepID=UPI00362B80A2